MLPGRVSNPGPLTYESGALPIALRGSIRMLKVTLCLLTYSIVKANVASNFYCTECSCFVCKAVHFERCKSDKKCFSKGINVLKSDLGRQDFRNSRSCNRRFKSQFLTNNCFPGNFIKMPHDQLVILHTSEKIWAQLFKASLA